MTQWNLKSNSGKRVASGMYIAILKLMYADDTIELLKTRIGITGN